MQIAYDEKIAPEAFTGWSLVSNKKKRPAPLTEWTVVPLTYEKQQFYIFVEKQTGFPIVTDSLEFKRVHDIFIFWLGVGQGTARYWERFVEQLIKSSSISQQTYPNLTAERYRKFLSKNKKLVQNNIPGQGARAGQYLYALTVTLLLNISEQVDNDFHIALLKNYGKAPQKPKEKFKYIDLPLTFTNPRQWEEYEWERWELLPMTEQKNMNKTIRK
ncbi:hypothetical protein GTO87_09110 [Ligilactobacillus saerimneri]|uniref:Uncharacterized protein n=1 Tax=Ligilactobacillus saerimneri TaxID=228229 RepID=A0A7H9EN24_9LACO|nr:hypothetical protein [Ligilactobacillus saerimneri]QLL78729.1 hypothetical protein GTO87_09110 [Ligilactobacillus saerimneri]